MMMLTMMHVRPMHEPMIAPSSWSDNAAGLSVDLNTYHTHTHDVIIGGVVALLVECRTCNQEVVGSGPEGNQ